jgi:hypothetical protein
MLQRALNKRIVKIAPISNASGIEKRVLIQQTQARTGSIISRFVLRKNGNAKQITTMKINKMVKKKAKSIFS